MYDYFCLTKENTVTAEFHTTANYDHILPVLVVIACRRLGLGQRIGDLLFDSLSNPRHRVWTMYGISKEYGSTLEHTFFGTGQGSSGPHTFWAVILEALFNSINAQRHGLQLSNLDGSISNGRNEDSYVDDTSIEVDGRKMREIGVSK